eukprot:3961273-Prymnesium_polylepis.1
MTPMPSTRTTAGQPFQRGPAWDKKVDFVTNPCSGMNTSAPSGLNGLTRAVWTGVTHLQRFGSV